MLGEDINIKDTTLLFATDNIFITAHTNAGYVSFTTTVYYDSLLRQFYYDSFYYRSDTKGKDTKVQYQLMICVSNCSLFMPSQVVTQPQEFFMLSW